MHIYFIICSSLRQIKGKGVGQGVRLEVQLFLQRLQEQHMQKLIGKKEGQLNFATAPGLEAQHSESEAYLK